MEYLVLVATTALPIVDNAIVKISIPNLSVASAQNLASNMVHSGAFSRVEISDQDDNIVLFHEADDERHRILMGGTIHHGE